MLTLASGTPSSSGGSVSGAGGIDLSLYIPPDPIKTALVSGLVPGIIALIALLIVWWPTRRGADRQAWYWAVPLMFLMIVVWLEVAIRGWPSQLWPPQVGNRFVQIGVLLSLAGLVHAFVKSAWVGPVIGGLLAASSVAVVFLEPGMRPDHPMFKEVLWHLPVVVGVVVLQVVVLSRVNGPRDSETNTPAWLLPAATLPAFGLAGPALALAGTAGAAELSAVLPTVATAGVVVSLFCGKFNFSRGGWTVLIGWLAGLILFNTLWGHNSLSPVAALLLAIGPVAACVVALPKVRDLPNPVRLLLGWTLTSGPVLIAVMLAYRVAVAAQADAYIY